MRGFTLIELLAVIVILSIILLISVPVISNVIEGVKKNSFKISSQHIAKAAEYTYAKEVITDARELVFLFENYEMSANFPDAELNFNGKAPQNGNIIIRKDGKMAYSFHDGKYCVEKNYDENQPIINEKSSDDCVSEVALPELTLVGQNPQYIEVNETFTDEGVTAVGVFGNPIITIDVEYIKETDILPTINPALMGTYRVIYTVEEDGKINYTERTVVVRDTIAPVLNIPTSNSLIINEVNTFNLMEGVSVSDNSLETLSIQTTGSIARIAGSYEITYSATDSSGNTTSISRMINISDIEAPIITITGNQIINLNVGDTYTELGATALDDADGDLTSSIITSGSVNTSTPGTYFITYTITDSSNNESSLTRTVNVIDAIDPVVTISPNGATNVLSASITVTSTDLQSGLSSLQYAFTNNATTPSSGWINVSSGSILNLTTIGTYYLHIKAVDNSTNTTNFVSNVFTIVPDAFVKTFGGSNRDEIFDTVATPDGGYIVYATSDSTTGDLNGISYTPGSSLIIRYNSSDVRQYIKPISHGGKLLKSSDNNYYIVGMASSTTYITKFDINGNILWAKTHANGIYNPGIHSAIIDSSGNIIMVGQSSGYPTENGIIASYDSNGNYKWHSEIDEDYLITNGGSIRTYFNDVIEYSPGAYMAVGSQNAWDGWNYDSPAKGVVYGFNSSGGYTSRNVYRDSRIQDYQTASGFVGYNIRFRQIEKIGSNIYISGESNFPDQTFLSHNGTLVSSTFTGKGNYDAIMLSINSSNTLNWVRTYGGTSGDSASSMLATSDGNILLGANTYSNNGDITTYRGSSDSLLVKLNTSGTKIWSKTYGGTNEDMPRKVIEPSNNKYIITGATSSTNYDFTMYKGGTYDGYIIKTNSSGQ